MNAALHLAIIALLLAQSAFAAEAGQPKASPSLSENLQLTSFSVNPQSIHQGDLAEFSLGVKSMGNTVSDYDASVLVTDTSGKQVGRLKFIHAAIAGGETQDLSKVWDSAGVAPGNYSVIANITDSTGASKVLLSRIEIIPAPSSDSGSGQQGQNPPGAGAALPAQEADCSAPASCEAPGNCIDNYTTELCSIQGCPDKDYYLVQRCMPDEPPIVLRAEGKICNSASFLCTDSEQGDWLTSVCLSATLITIVLLAALLFRTRNYRL